jgi:hypothetical protein
MPLGSSARTRRNGLVPAPRGFVLLGLRAVTAVAVKIPMDLRSLQCDGAFGSPYTGPPPAKRISIETDIRQLEENLLLNLAAAHRVWTLPQVCPNTRNQFSVAQFLD